MGFLINRRHKIYEKIKELQFEIEHILTKVYELNAEYNLLTDGGTYLDSTTIERAKALQYRIKSYQSRIREIDIKIEKLYRKV